MKALAIALVTVTIPASVLAPTSAAAVQHHPQGAFAVFADCPLNNPAVAQCIVAHITGGEFVLGKKTVPINHTITLQAGLIHAPGPNYNAYVLAGAEDGNTLSKTALNVPGGLSVGGGSTGEITATAELATAVGTAKLDLAALIEENGAALTLPLKLKLNNPLLGSSCYVGGATDPVTLALTDGRTSPPPPNRPISGSSGHIRSVFEQGLEVVEVSGEALVDNSFAAPGASGCNGILGASLVDQFIGLPAPAGHNTAILNADVDLAEVDYVTASEHR